MESSAQFSLLVEAQHAPREHPLSACSCMLWTFEFEGGWCAVGRVSSKDPPTCPNLRAGGRLKIRLDFLAQIVALERGHDPNSAQIGSAPMESVPSPNSGPEKTAWRRTPSLECRVLGGVSGDHSLQRSGPATGDPLEGALGYPRPRSIPGRSGVDMGRLWVVLAQGSNRRRISAHPSLYKPRAHILQRGAHIGCVAG